LKVDQRNPYFTGHAEFLETVFTNFNFEKLLLYEALVTDELLRPVTSKRSFLGSYKLKKLFER